VATCEHHVLVITRLFVILGALLLGSAARGAEEDDVGRAVQVLHDTYGDQLGDTDLFRAALDGIARELDRTVGRPGHAVVDAKDRAKVERWLDGHRHGIAAEFAIVPGQGIVITDVYAGGPAERAGLQVGDLVVALDDRPFTGLSADFILAIASEIQSREVVLDVRRPEGLRRIPISRGPWRLDTARAFDHHGVTVLKLPFFGPGSARAVAHALEPHPDNAPLVIDLRTNEGGRLEAMVEVASLFVPKGRPIVMVDSGQGEPTTHSARAAVSIPGPGPVVILVDRDTSGTAEAFAAALRHEAHAVIVGSPTAGRDGLPRWVPVGDHLFLRVMADQLRDPTGSTWAGSGVVPDILSQPVSRPMPVQPGQLPPDVQLDVAAQVAGRAGVQSATDH